RLAEDVAQGESDLGCVSYFIRPTLERRLDTARFGDQLLLPAPIPRTPSRQPAKVCELRVQASTKRADSSALIFKRIEVDCGAQDVEHHIACVFHRCKAPLPRQQW